MSRVPVPVSRSVNHDQLNSEVIIMISPIRLGSGGSARLARVAVSHQKVINGATICSPRARSIVRLCVRS